MSYIAAFGMLMMFFMACIVLLRLVAIDNKSTGSTLRLVSTVPESILTPVLMPAVSATHVAKPDTMHLLAPVLTHASLLSWLMPQLSKPSLKKNNTTVRKYITSQNLRGSIVVCNENSEKMKSYNISFPVENDEDIIIAQVQNLLPQIYDKGYKKIRVCHSNCVSTSVEFKFNLISIFPKFESSIQDFFKKFESIGNPYEVQFCKL